jgi:hypothetical protein
MIGAGCASRVSTEGKPPPAVARLEIDNRTDYEWHIAVVAVKGGEAHSSRVRARGAFVLNLAGGEYVIEQTVTGAGPELARRLPALLVAGQTYRWRLATLRFEANRPPGRTIR